MKAVDRYTIETVGIPSMVLMERAAMAVAREAERLAGQTGVIWSVCGMGNNGADGVAAARMLALKGYTITIITVGKEDGGTREFRAQLEIAGKLGVPVIRWKDFAARYREGCAGEKLCTDREACVFGAARRVPACPDVLIDGIFGVGLTRDVEGEYRDLIKAMSATGAKVVAVDIPSGIHSATGQIMGAALKADVTVTFGCGKMGSMLYPGKEYCGRLVVEDIGFPKISYDKAGPLAWTYGAEDLKGLPARPAYSNKGTFGKVLLIAGSRGMSGAAFLAALAAYRVGAGLVKIMTVEENRAVLQQQLPEAIVTTYRPEELSGGAGGVCDRLDGPSGRSGYGSQDGPVGRSGYGRQGECDCRTGQDWGPCHEGWEKRMEQECAWADVIVAGPGLGQEPYVRLLIQSVLTSAYVPMVLDADGLNAIAKYPYLEQYYTENIVITPHLGEMARLTGKSIEEIQRDIPGTAREYSGAHGVVCVLKDAATVVTGREGQCYVNASGNSCMAKAGSGDVLAGTVAGLLAQKMEPFDGAAMAVYIHGLGGDRYREEQGPAKMLARELAEEVGKITREA